jgi:hypothetical protein
MPSIMATPYPTRGHVLVEVSMADVPGATHVCVEAITGFGTSDEVRRQLHPYVSYNTDGCLALSCGQAIFWDTEISCGVATVYCATAIDSDGDPVTEPADALITATFSTVAAASWPPADTGQVFVNTGGAAADYSGTGTRGQHAVTSTGVLRVSSTAMSTANAVAEITAFPVAVALTQATEQHLWLRADAAGANGYRARLRYNTTGTVDLILERVVAGVATSLGLSSSVATYIATTGIGVKLQVWGSSLSAKAWDITTPEPAFQLTATDTTYTAAGVIAASSLRNVGNTNGTVNMQWDNLSVLDVCADVQSVTTCTDAVTIECDGCFRLGNPVRPCDDVRVCLCADGVECGGTGGLFFVSMTPDTRTDNSGQMLPVNDQYPIPVSRRRMKPTSTLTVTATSFAARDELINLLDPGEPLLLRTTPEYGIGDRYLQIGDVPETYTIADMTIQPRLLQMPNAEVRAPVGPSLGVCGSRVMDLCDIYDTWDELIAAGLTYADLIRGEASPPGSGLATWDDINAQNVDWDALLIAEPDWNDVLDGD